MKTALCLWLSCWGMGFAVLGQIIEDTNSLYNAPAEPSQDKPDNPIHISNYDTSPERGPHHRIHYTVRQTVDESGQSVLVTNRYIQLTSGMHYWEDGQWKESEALIEAHPQGAVARRGPHKVIFNRKLGQAGSIDLLAPDGTRLRSHLLGLCYLDPITGQRAWLGMAKQSEGEILPPNQVIYRDALDGIKADLRYTYSLSGLEQDLILLEQPSTPEELGLDSATVRLEVVTEFVDAPLPTIDGKKLRGTPEEDLLRSQDYTAHRDEQISLDRVYFGLSRAFPQGNTEQSDQLPLSLSGRTAGKRWLRQGARQFLLEQIPYEEVLNELRNLSAFRGSESLGSEPTAAHPANRTGRFETFPAVHLAQNNPQQAPMNMSQENTFLRLGFVLDYTTIIAPMSGFIFFGNVTYFVSGQVFAYGQVFVDGNAIIKMDTTRGTMIVLDQPMIFRTGPTRPAVFSIKDDDSLGEMITGSNHNPAMVTGNDWFALYSCSSQSGPGIFNHVRFKYLQSGIFFSTLYSAGGSTNWIRNTQFYKCGYPLVASYNTVLRIQNVLFDDVFMMAYPITNSAITCILENATVHHARELNVYSNATFYMTNCLFYNVTNPTPAGPCYSSHTLISNEHIFASVAGGSGYLGDNSYRNIGTTNIHPRLIAELRTKTTCPPSVLTSVSQDTVLGPNPAVLRDIDLPDIGYHYEPLDYLVSSLALYHTLTLTNGVAVGVYGTNGLVLGSGGKLISGATPQQHNFLVNFKTIQEAAIPGESNSVSLVTVNSSSATEVNLRFTDLSVLNLMGGARFFTLNSNPIAMSFRDCRFTSGTNHFTGYLAFTNCLFEAGGYNWNSQSLCLANNTFCGGNFNYQIAAGSACAIKNTFFDMTLITYGSIAGSHSFRSNAYVSTIFGTLYPPEPLPPVILPTYPIYEKGPFGDHYLPLHSIMDGLFCGGDGSPASNGLGHYTTSANNWSRTGETVTDIGLHYVKAQTDGRQYFNKAAIPNSASASSSYNSSVLPCHATDDWLNTIWHSANQGTNEWFRFDLQNALTVSKVTYHSSLGCLNGTFLQYAIYVTSSASTNRADWGSPIVEGGWDWPIGAETKEVTFAPTTGQYVIFLCKRGVNNWASGAEFGVYLHGTTTHLPGLPIDSDSDGLPDYVEDANGNGVLDAGETDYLSLDRWFFVEGSLPPGCVNGNGSSRTAPKAINYNQGTENWFDYQIGRRLKGYALKTSSDPEMVDPNATVRLHFYGGTYLTDGVPNTSSSSGDTWITHPKVVLDREVVTGGNNRVVFKLRDNASNPEGNKYLVQSGVFLSDFQISDIEFDCNWAGQVLYNTALYHDGYKNGGLCIQSVQAKVENVSVYSFGANGPSPLVGAGWVAYPLLIRSASLGQPSSPPPLTITNCIVSNFTGVNGGKAIAIAVETRDHTVPANSVLDGYSQYPSGYRTTPMAMVTSNAVVNTHTNENLIGFGVFNSEQVTFTNNVAEAVEVGFIGDRLFPNPAINYLEMMTNLAFLNNTVRSARGGLSIGEANLPTNRFVNVRISNNNFQISGWKPAEAGRWKESFGVRLNGGTSGVSIQNNTFTTVPSQDFSFPDQSYFSYHAPAGLEYFYFNNPLQPADKVYYPIRVMGLQNPTYPWIPPDYAFGNNILPPSIYPLGSLIAYVTNGASYVYIKGNNDSCLFNGSYSYYENTKFVANANVVDLSGTQNSIVTAQLQVPYYFYTNASPILTGNSPAVTPNQSVSPN